jgi:uncharacterized protein
MPMNQQKLTRSIIIILVFLISSYGNRIASVFFDFTLPSVYLRIAYVWLWFILPALVASGMLFGFRNIPEVLGLNKGFLFGLGFAALTVSPMMISSALVGKISEELVPVILIHKTFLAGFGEEFLFRGFLFGLLFRKAGWGFFPASLLGAVFFGAGHLYQGEGLFETLGVFMITAVGAAGYAWFYIEWNNNLWVPIFLHSLMNLSWSLFDVGNNALGGWYANLFRVLTITAAVIITIRHSRKHGFKIRRENLIDNGY